MNGSEWGDGVREDDNGEYEVDSSGNRRIPLQTKRKTVSSGFTTYDDSRGHCPLCGSLTCRGGCFR